MRSEREGRRNGKDKVKGQTGRENKKDKSEPRNKEIQGSGLWRNYHLL